MDFIQQSRTSVSGTVMKMREIINKLIIVAGQWQQFGGIKYEREFSDLLNELRHVAGTTPEGSVQLFLAEIEKEGVAA